MARYRTARFRSALARRGEKAAQNFRHLSRRADRQRFTSAHADRRDNESASGGDDAYLDENAIAQAWARHPRQSARGLMQLYLDAIPDKAFADSCLFHAKDGCSLPRSLRAPVSEAYLCGPLSRLMKG
jgi:hypothetical protein